MKLKDLNDFDKPPGQLGPSCPMCHMGSWGRSCALSQTHSFKSCHLVNFSRMRSEGSPFTWGSGGEAVFAKFCVCGRNRPQPLA